MLGTLRLDHFALHDQLVQLQLEWCIWWRVEAELTMEYTRPIARAVSVALSYELKNSGTQKFVQLDRTQVIAFSHWSSQHFVPWCWTSFGWRHPVPSDSVAGISAPAPILIRMCGVDTNSFLRIVRLLISFWQNLSVPHNYPSFSSSNIQKNNFYKSSYHTFLRHPKPKKDPKVWCLFFSCSFPFFFLVVGAGPGRGPWKSIRWTTSLPPNRQPAGDLRDHRLHLGHRCLGEFHVGAAAGRSQGRGARGPQ